MQIGTAPQLFPARSVGGDNFFASGSGIIRLFLDASLQYPFNQGAVRVSNAKSPFVKKAVTCPVCNSQAENRFIMPKSFIVKSLESDRHVSEYKWLDEAFNQYHPSFYHFWHCPACKYTATQRDFLKPGEDTRSNFSALKEAYLQMKPSQKQIIQMLGREVDFDQMNFSMAMNLHLMAIFIQELVTADIPDTSKIASYYLRAGWLIREQEAKEDSDEQWATHKKFLEEMGKLWPEVPQSEAECLEKAAENYEEAYQSHPRYADVVHATELMILIADIYFRAGVESQAMKSLKNVMQTGQKFRAKQQELIRREKEAGRLSMARKAQIDAEGNRINLLMERAGDMHQEIVKKRVAQQEPKAEAVVAKLQARGMNSKAIREKLKELKFEPQLITKLLGEPKRKKFLGLL